MRKKTHLRCLVGNACTVSDLTRIDNILLALKGSAADYGWVSLKVFRCWYQSLTSILVPEQSVLNTNSILTTIRLQYTLQCNYSLQRRKLFKDLGEAGETAFKLLKSRNLWNIYTVVLDYIKYINNCQKEH